MSPCRLLSPVCLGRWSIAAPTSRYTVPAALLPEGLAADAQRGRGAGLASRRLLEDVADVGLLDLLEGGRLLAPGPERLRLLEDVRGKGGEGHTRTVRQESGPLHR